MATHIDTYIGEDSAPSMPRIAAVIVALDKAPSIARVVAGLRADGRDARPRHRR